MANEALRSPSLWDETPLLYSQYISARLECNAYLKLENLHPSQSFKFRGVSLFVKKSFDVHGPSVHFVIASSGNAALALACATNKLGVRCTVFIPTGSASVKPILEMQNATVEVGGVQYIDALRIAQEAVRLEDNAVLVPSYDDPILWEGHSSMVHEIQSQLPHGTIPDAIFCSVGGGGLIGGVLTGCRALQWDHVTVVGLETYGANCFHLSMLSNPSFTEGSLKPPPTPPAGVSFTTYGSEEPVTLASLPSITSQAASLGANTPSLGVVKMALARHSVKCVSVPDEMSMATGLSFTDEHKWLTELACSTTLVPAYNPGLFRRILPTSQPLIKGKRTVIFIVCGGVKVNLEEVEGYRKAVSEAGNAVVLVDGESWVDH